MAENHRAAAMKDTILESFANAAMMTLGFLGNAYDTQLAKGLGHIAQDIGNEWIRAATGRYWMSHGDNQDAQLGSNFYGWETIEPQQEADAHTEPQQEHQPEADLDPPDELAQDELER